MLLLVADNRYSGPGYVALAQETVSSLPPVATVPAVPHQTQHNNAANKHVRLAGLGALLGFAAGYAVKKIGRMFLLVLGLEFILLQALASR